MCPLCKVHTLPTVHGVLVVAIASRPPSQAGRGSYSHKLAMSICTFCYLYSLAICYKTNRKLKLEERHFDPLSSVQKGRIQVRRSDEQTLDRFIARAVKMADGAGLGVHSPLQLYNCCKVGADEMHTEVS